MPCWNLGSTDRHRLAQDRTDGPSRTGGQTNFWKSRTGRLVHVSGRTGWSKYPNWSYPICVKICCAPFLIVTWILSRSNLDSDIEIFWKWIKSFRFDLLQSNSVGGIALIVNRKRSKHFLIFSSISVVSYFVSRNLASDEPLRRPQSPDSENNPEVHRWSDLTDTISRSLHPEWETPKSNSQVNIRISFSLKNISRIHGQLKDVLGWKLTFQFSP